MAPRALHVLAASSLCGSRICRRRCWKAPASSQHVSGQQKVPSPAAFTHTHPGSNLQPGHVPDWESNLQSSGVRDDAPTNSQPAGPHHLPSLLGSLPRWNRVLDSRVIPTLKSFYQACFIPVALTLLKPNLSWEPSMSPTSLE